LPGGRNPSPAHTNPYANAYSLCYTSSAHNDRHPLPIRYPFPTSADQHTLCHVDPNLAGDSNPHPDDHAYTYPYPDGPAYSDGDRYTTHGHTHSDNYHHAVRVIYSDRNSYGFSNSHAPDRSILVG
jgi:hypothetical protein